ncbi:MAG TPA: hypothetical protein VKU92_06515 [Acidimicrobiales bacterium]|nr:hypothetical protein [Acidimicrobiales bacterium]
MRPAVPRSRLAVARRITPGTPRAEGPEGSLDCLLLAPAPDWVAVDLATGALVRSGLTSGPVPELLESGGPLRCLRLALAPAGGAWDPSRPEAVGVAAAEETASPPRRSVRRLLALLAEDGARSMGSGSGPGAGGPGLLGGIGPSLPFVELSGDRPSVTVLDPDAGKVRIVHRSDSELVAHFRLAASPHALPLARGAARWVTGGEVPTVSGRSVAGYRGRRRSREDVAALGPGLETAVHVLLVVGLDRPAGGQVRKLVLGVVPTQ